MSSSPTTLLGGSLVFERAGQALVAMDPDAISVVELGAGGRTTRIPIRDARAVAAFADQLWVATHDDQLVRMDHAGRPLAPPCALPFSARAMLQPAPCGPAAAVWSSHPALALIDDFGQLVATELPAVDLALPLTGRRFVTARGAKLTLPSGLVTALPPNTNRPRRTRHRMSRPPPRTAPRRSQLVRSPSRTSRRPRPIPSSSRPRTGRRRRSPSQSPLHPSAGKRRPPRAMAQIPDPH